MKGCTRTTLLSALFVATAVLGAACSGDNGEDAEQQGMNAGETLDPNGLLASLTFATAEDDARYRCLLSRLDAQAETAGFEEFPPVDFRGDVLKSWCSATGEDGNQCMRGLVLGLNGRGNQGTAVWAYRERSASAAEEYGYRVGRNPASDAASVWSLDFERTRGAIDGFIARFVPFDADERDYARDINIAERGTFQLDGQGVDDIIATLEPESPPAELLATLVESPARFTEVLVARHDALLAEYERLVANADGLDEGARTAAMERAREQVGIERAAVSDNADAMHASLRDALIGEDCG